MQALAFRDGSPAGGWALIGRLVTMHGWASRPCALALCLVAFTGASALAQDDPIFIPRDTFGEHRLQEGNALTLCYNSSGMMADFEVDLARAIGDVLLLEAQAVRLPDANITTPPLDFRLPLLGEQVYIMLAERCAAIMGFGLGDSVPEWLLVTRPYVETRTVLVTMDPAIRTLADLPFDRPIGARGMSVADNRLINFLQARPADQRWRRFPFFSNQVVLDKLRDGSIGVGLIWEPALYYATGGDPEGEGFYILEDMPFAAPAVELGIATRSDERYLNEQLSGAIAALQADGTIDRLLRAHNLSAAENGGGGG